MSNNTIIKGLKIYDRQYTFDIAESVKDLIKSDILNSIYPVGSLYFMANLKGETFAEEDVDVVPEECPLASLIVESQWEKLDSSLCLMTASSSSSGMRIGNFQNNITLTQEQIPGHVHSIRGIYTSESGNGQLSFRLQPDGNMVVNTYEDGEWKNIWVAKRDNGQTLSDYLDGREKTGFFDAMTFGQVTSGGFSNQNAQHMLLTNIQNGSASSPSEVNITPDSYLVTVWKRIA